MPRGGGCGSPCQAQSQQKFMPHPASTQKKLESYEITGRLCFIESYLSNRTLVVRHSSALSYLLKGTSGVPQGLLLGLFFFNLFVNDISEVLNEKFLQFSHDINLYVEVHSILNRMCLQYNLNGLLRWCNDNSMNLKEKKCVLIISFTRSQQNFIWTIGLDSTSWTLSDVQDLGVTFLPNLHPSRHVNKICARANSHMMAGIHHSIKQRAFLHLNCKNRACNPCTLSWNTMLHFGPITPWNGFWTGKNSRPFNPSYWSQDGMCLLMRWEILLDFFPYLTEEYWMTVFLLKHVNGNLD